jgi:aspartate/tyrosine/aromatic aminotransferase
MISVVSEQKPETVLNQILEITRGLYFMPPNPGAAIVVEILKDSALKKIWLDELNTMRERMTSLRAQFSAAMNSNSKSDKFNFIASQYGMFSFLPVTPEHVERLTEEFSVYMIPNGRINIAGLTFKKIDYVAKAICNVIKD